MIVDSFGLSSDIFLSKRVMDGTYFYVKAYGVALGLRWHELAGRKLKFSAYVSVVSVTTIQGLK